MSRWNPAARYCPPPSFCAVGFLRSCFCAGSHRMDVPRSRIPSVRRKVQPEGILFVWYARPSFGILRGYHVSIFGLYFKCVPPARRPTGSPPPGNDPPSVDLLLSTPLLLTHAASIRSETRMTASPHVPPIQELN